RMKLELWARPFSANPHRATAQREKIELAFPAEKKRIAETNIPGTSASGMFTRVTKLKHYKWEQFHIKGSLTCISQPGDFINSFSGVRNKPMKTYRSYAIAASIQRRGIFHLRLFVAALLLALLLAALPAASALAAPARDGGTTGDIYSAENINEEEGWQNKLDHLRWAGFYYDTVRFFPADFERSSDLARVHELLEKYGVALRAANTIVL